MRDSGFFGRWCGLGDIGFGRRCRVADCRRTQPCMGAVTEGPIGGGFALAQGGIAILIGGEFQRTDVSACMAAVAEWLALGHTTLAPEVVFPFFECDLDG
jgi:hypothetical protein